MLKKHKQNQQINPNHSGKSPEMALAKLMAKLRLNATTCLKPWAGLQESKILARDHLTGATWLEVAAQGVRWVVKNATCQWRHLTTTKG